MFDNILVYSSDICRDCGNLFSGIYLDNCNEN